MFKVNFKMTASGLEERRGQSRCFPVNCKVIQRRERSRIVEEPLECGDELSLGLASVVRDNCHARGHASPCCRLHHSPVAMTCRGEL